MNKNELSPEQYTELINLLKARFEKYSNRHKDLAWADVQARLETQSDKLSSLFQMEETGGEPDVIGYNKKTGEYDSLSIPLNEFVKSDIQIWRNNSTVYMYAIISVIIAFYFFRKLKQ